MQETPALFPFATPLRYHLEESGAVISLCRLDIKFRYSKVAEAKNMPKMSSV